ncbi:MAG: NADH-quinone oxidoreductase subunit NuoG [Burkholderiaceae bacterium]
MIEVTIDGQKVEVLEGSMVMHAVEKLGQYVPHFCYHKKLSIAANCRMCLVEVEKAPKPMPACATPVSQGMIVHTKSEKAVKAQQGVMEFLLINHPLDCPICDQGGECQLQDLAVGYGTGASRYTEEKRVVFHKSLGPLVSAEEMSRCIHCTRCVRFGQEIAGVMELGMLNRGEHAEITSFLGRTVDSELSGNMIDVCPVGALTSKPFRYAARTWELARRKAISPHDSLGANLVVQVKNNRVMRVVPQENEAVNECWISDRDRFSYEGLNSEDRLTVPMVKRDGQWQATDWATALATAVAGIQESKKAGGAAVIGALFSASSTVEEVFLLNKVVRTLDSDNIDFRLRMHDFSLDAARVGVPWLGMPIEEVATLDRMLVVGSFLRKDHPLLAARVRSAVKRGGKVSVVHSADDDLLMPLASKCIVPPSAIPAVLAEIAVAIAREKGLAVPEQFAGIQVRECAAVAAKSLAGGQRAGVLLGNFAVNHPQASAIQATLAWISNALNARLGVLTEQANTVGAYALGAYHRQGAVKASKATVLLNVEPALDAGNGAELVKQLKEASCVIALTAYKSAVHDVATVMLPITPFTETAGSFVNAAGQLQLFTAAVPPFGESRPAWKVLRVLGTQLELPGFDFDSAESVRVAALGDGSSLTQKLSNLVEIKLSTPNGVAQGIERVADVPIYHADAIVRRAESLQQTADAKAPVALLNPQDISKLGLQAGQMVRVSSDTGEVLLRATASDRVAAGSARISTSRNETAALGDMFGLLKIGAA